MLLQSLSNAQLLLQKIAQISSLIHSYGWAEANAGNLSIDVSTLVPRLEPDTSYYVVSRTGSRYRQTAIDPAENLVLIRCSRDQEQCFPKGAKPTMEWASHRCLQKAIGDNTVVLHTHPAEIIAMANSGYSTEDLNSRFAAILPELPLYLPDGFAIAQHRPPGSQELCDASLEAYQGQKALIWSGHGILCFGKSLDEALDYMEIMVKAAKIHLLLGH